jgi:hypothetical protein
MLAQVKNRRSATGGYPTFSGNSGRLDGQVLSYSLSSLAKLWLSPFGPVGLVCADLAADLVQEFVRQHLICTCGFGLRLAIERPAHLG